MIDCGGKVPCKKDLFAVGVMDVIYKFAPEVYHDRMDCELIMTESSSLIVIDWNKWGDGEAFGINYEHTEKYIYFHQRMKSLETGIS